MNREALRDFEAIRNGQVPDEVGRLLSEVEAERVDWLWRGRIPKGKLTLIDGDPGLVAAAGGLRQVREHRGDVRARKVQPGRCHVGAVGEHLDPDRRLPAQQHPTGDRQQVAADVVAGGRRVQLAQVVHVTGHRFAFSTSAASLVSTTASWCVSQPASTNPVIRSAGTSSTRSRTHPGELTEMP